MLLRATAALVANIMAGKIPATSLTIFGPGNVSGNCNVAGGPGAPSGDQLGGPGFRVLIDPANKVFNPPKASPQPTWTQLDEPGTVIEINFAAINSSIGIVRTNRYFEADIPDTAAGAPVQLWLQGQGWFAAPGSLTDAATMAARNRRLMN